MSDRPPVSVIVPFYGSREAATAVLASLVQIETADGDELIVADNTPAGVRELEHDVRVRRVPAGDVQSSYHARNAGADAASNEWLLFLDADCEPRPEILAEYFGEAIGPRTGAVAGEVVGSDGQTSLAARYSYSRRHIGQGELRDHPYKPMAVTANLLVRRAVWQELGGFHEGVRSGGDADFSWRLQDAGYDLGYAPTAVASHRHRETIRALMRQSARYGAGMRWLGRRHPDVRFDGRVGGIARSLVGAVLWTLTGRFERALFKGLDGAWTAANAVGSLASNVHPVPTVRSAEPGTTVVVQRFPDPGDTRAAQLARELASSGRTATVESAGRVERPDRRAAADVRAIYAEDDGPLRRLADLAWLAARHPLRCASDLGRREASTNSSLPSLASRARRIARRGDGQILIIPGDPGGADGRRIGRLLGLGVTADHARRETASAEPAAT